MPPGSAAIRFAWWNVQSFAHFDPNRAGEERWPLEPEEYSTKCARVDAALQGLIDQNPPDLLGLCEITSHAAEDLRQRLFPNHDLVCPDAMPGAGFQVVILCRRSAEFRIRLPLLAKSVPRTTRAMAVVDYYAAGHCIKFICCHWTAFGENSRLYRDRLAETVSSHVYDFLSNKRRTKTRPHVVIMGDLNEEPFGELFHHRLRAFRDRERTLSPVHASDRDTHRVRLYNAAWRLLGERHPHDALGIPSTMPEPITILATGPGTLTIRF